jgi:hypothetical protein
LTAGTRGALLRRSTGGACGALRADDAVGLGRDGGVTRGDPDAEPDADGEREGLGSGDDATGDALGEGTGDEDRIEIEGARCAGVPVEFHAGPSPKLSWALLLPDGAWKDDVALSSGVYGYDA